jgi:secretion/DNA translocation related TadE-like protein
MSGRCQRGQAVVLTVVFLTGLLGAVALTLDVGSWFRTQRKLQATADAAALAAAQALPQDPGQASALAGAYVTKNGGGTANATISTTFMANDTVRVQVERPVPGVFARLFGIDSVQVGARAGAYASVPSAARWAAPIAVDERHLLLTGPGCPCFGQATDLDLNKVGPGAFRLVNVDGSHGGTGPQIVADWIRRGYEGYMPIDWYFSDPGTKFNSSQIENALDERIGDVLLFPVYRETIAQGANFQYHVVGWVGFRLTGYLIQGSQRSELYGRFETITWEGIQSDGPGDPNFGARTIALIE